MPNYIHMFYPIHVYMYGTSHACILILLNATAILFKLSLPYRITATTIKDGSRMVFIVNGHIDFIYTILMYIGQPYCPIKV